MSVLTTKWSAINVPQKPSTACADSVWTLLNKEVHAEGNINRQELINTSFQASCIDLIDDFNFMNQFSVLAVGLLTEWLKPLD